MTVAIASSSCSGMKERPKRAYATHIPKWQSFQPEMITPSEKASSVSKQEAETYAYNKQYSHVYHQRLTALKPRCWNIMMKDTSNYTRINRVLELREDIPSMIVGTLVKEANDIKEEPLLSKNSECRPSDQLFLEDGSGRVALAFLDAGKVHEYCTGIVVGVKGKVDKMGTFTVDEVVLPDPFPSPQLNGNVAMSTSSPDNDDEDSPKHSPHLLIVSSMLCGDPNVSSLPRDMLVSYLQGHFTNDAAQVSRVVIAGSGPSSQDPIQGIKELDQFCLQISRIGIPLDIMPSKEDPTTLNWPQRPLHSSLLPHATNTLFRTPNPYAAGHGNQFVVGTDGINVQDLQNHTLVTVANTLRKSGDEDKDEDSEEYRRLTELEALERTLEWSHICPTGPQSVPTVPHLDGDPMVLTKRPHIYFCGNAKEGFATKATADGSSTLICVPKFSDSCEAVLVDLETRDVKLLRFDANEE